MDIYKVLDRYNCKRLSKKDAFSLIDDDGFFEKLILSHNFPLNSDPNLFFDVVESDVHIDCDLQVVTPRPRDKNGENRGVPLIIGNLSCSSNLTMSSASQLFVTGNLEVKNILSSGTLFVSGHLKACEAAIFYYNDDSTSIGREVSARWFCTDDHWTDYKKLNSSVEINSTFDGTKFKDFKKLLALLNPEIFELDEVLPPRPRDDEYGPKLLYNWGIAKELLASKGSLFRSYPASTQTLEAVINLFYPKPLKKDIKDPLYEHFYLEISKSMGW